MYSNSKFVNSTILVFAISVLMSCTNGEPKKNQPLEVILPADFSPFYSKFHSDSIFQINHIIFPLEGIQPYADSSGFENNSFRWEAQDWIMHRAMKDENYRISYNTPSSNVVNEFIFLKDGTFGIQRRFAKINQEWYLIYYVGTNKLK